MDAIAKATAFGLDRIYNSFEKRTAVSSAIEPQQPMSRYPDLVEGSSPCADTGTAGVSDSQYRARIYKYERLIDRLYDLARAERFDELHDVVRAEYLAIHGPQS